MRIYKAEDIFIGIQKIDNSYILRDDISNEYVKIYYPDVENNSKMDGREDFVGIYRLFVLTIE